MEKISAGTISRTIILALALFNQIMSSTGHSILPIDDGDIETLVSLAFTLAATVAAWWKNNSFTQKAIKADAYMDELKVAEILDKEKNE